ncbi:MAG: mechanosensitive ion channel family protein [Gammaproteobacteria bacterium]|nr:mechanosensitive ion channel family protein [Rhodocyclaceae bacterium]MBU3908566.1 mechanosensitive ion channel family protein [Gammaproteobacteria bacterium]MBU3989555.1 mechanosensitive ion channel family protein [Gammaproteobacteria bacterium]MBU4004594.1 mechanosensitive ion channel family protein [Gammaproteobacteria bacterium]MBU4021197.1 mechanosensitive ion channel family protein [Gammaproteobacteria bacterium]
MAVFDHISSVFQQLTPAMASGLRIVLILALAWVGVVFSHKLIISFRIYVSRNLADAEEVKRIATLGRVFRYTASVVISLLTGILILGELGISVAPLLGAAGVVGVAVGFGAQSLIKDYFTGFFILLENQMRQGDVIQAGGKAGVVEEITLRYVRMRDYDGNVHFVPNGSITTVTNMTRGFAFAVVDVGVAYRENVDQALAVMRRVGDELRADPVFGVKIIEDIEMVGVEKWADSAVILRCRFKVMPIEQWNVRREYLKRLKAAFDAAGIEIPFPHLTLYAGQAKDGAAPPFPLKLAGSANAFADKLE